MNVTTFTPEGILREAEREGRHPHAGMTSYCVQQHLDRISAFSGSGAGAADAPEEHSYPHNLRDEGTGDEKRFAAVSLNLHSDRMPSQPSGVQRSRKRRKPEQNVGQDEAIVVRRRTHKRKPCDLSGSTKRVSFLATMQETELKRSHCSFRQLPSSPAALPVLLRFRRRGTRPLPDKKTGRKLHLSNLGASN